MKFNYNNSELLGTFNGRVQELQAYLEQTLEKKIDYSLVAVEFTKDELDQERDKELQGFIIDNIFMNKEVIGGMSVRFATLADNAKANWIDVNNKTVGFTKVQLGALITKGSNKIEEVYFRYRALKDKVK